MFYVKEPLTDTLEVHVEINDENVFCHCPVCGKEVQVNLEKYWEAWKGTSAGHPSCAMPVPGNCWGCVMETDLKRNGEHYPDPTAYKAIRKAEPGKFPFRPVVYVCSPYSGDIEANVRKARRYCRYAADHGCIPLAPHLFLPQFLDERTERDLALFMGIALLSKCAELWIFGEIISQGMELEIRYAQKKGKPIKYISEVI